MVRDGEGDTVSETVRRHSGRDGEGDGEGRHACSCAMFMWRDAAVTMCRIRSRPSDGCPCWRMRAVSTGVRPSASCSVKKCFR
jgi:hypothetical protein